MMKYLFLDIDGVLNHEEWYRDRSPKYKYDFWWENCFDPECVKRVNKILQETGAELVISSSWRLDTNLKQYFEKVGLPTTFDRTPIVYKEDDGWADRGEEIEAFISFHPCDNYVILDDDMDFTEDQIQNHFVHCCADYTQAFKEAHVGETGLTELKMKEAINILNK